MLNGKINTTQGKIPFTLPTDWKELTVGQVVALNEPGLTEFEVLSILTQVEPEIWQACPYGFFEAWFMKAKVLLGTEQIDWFTLPVQREVTLNGKVITYPRDIKLAPSKAVYDIQDEYQMFLQAVGKKENPNHLRLIPSVLALLAVAPMNGGEYPVDGVDKAQELKLHAERIPAAIGLPLGNFFLPIWNVKPNTGINFLGINLLQSKLRQAYTSLTNSAA